MKNHCQAELLQKHLDENKGSERNLMLLEVVLEHQKYGMW